MAKDMAKTMSAAYAKNGHYISTLMRGQFYTIHILMDISIPFEFLINLGQINDRKKDRELIYRL